MNFKTKTSLTTLIIACGLSAAIPVMAATDSDGDGVPDNAEPLIQTDPQNPDTDGDGGICRNSQSTTPSGISIPAPLRPTSPT